MTPKSIDDAISTLKELEGNCETIRWTNHRKLWSDSVEEHYQYLIDRCQLFIVQAFKATVNHERYVFAVRISCVNYLEVSIHDRSTDKEIYTPFQDTEFVQIGLQRDSYQYNGRWDYLSCKRLIASFKHLQEHLNQLNKLKKTSTAKDDQPKKRLTSSADHSSYDSVF